MSTSLPSTDESDDENDTDRQDQRRQQPSPCPVKYPHGANHERNPSRQQRKAEGKQRSGNHHSFSRVGICHKRKHQPNKREQRRPVKDAIYDLGDITVTCHTHHHIIDPAERDRLGTAHSLISCLRHPAWQSVYTPGPWSLFDEK